MLPSTLQPMHEYIVFRGTKRILDCKRNSEPTHAWIWTCLTLMLSSKPVKFLNPMSKLWTKFLSASVFIANQFCHTFLHMQQSFRFFHIILLICNPFLKIDGLNVQYFSCLSYVRVHKHSIPISNPSTTSQNIVAWLICVRPMFTFGYPFEPPRCSTGTLHFEIQPGNRLKAYSFTIIKSFSSIILYVRH